MIGKKHTDRLMNFLRKGDKQNNLIHFANHVGTSAIPFVVDYESSCAFGSLSNNEKFKEYQKGLLKNKNLKYLLPFNEQASNSFSLYFPELKNLRQEILYKRKE